MIRLSAMTAIAVSWLLAGVATASGPEVIYEITVTNVTKGQTFTPILGATHSPGVGIFEVGEPASAELETLAETGNTAPLAGVLLGLGPHRVGEVVTAQDLLGPGETRVFELRGSYRHRRLTVAARRAPIPRTAMKGLSRSATAFTTSVLRMPTRMRFSGPSSMIGAIRWHG